MYQRLNRYYCGTREYRRQRYKWVRKSPDIAQMVDDYRAHKSVKLHVLMGVDLTDRALEMDHSVLGGNFIHDELDDNYLKTNLIYLFASGVNVNTGNYSGITYLHLQCEYGEVQFLIDAGADINVQDRHRHTPLMYAVESLNRIATQQLLEAGANIWLQGIDGSILIVATRNARSNCYDADDRLEFIRLIEMIVQMRPEETRDYVRSLELTPTPTTQRILKRIRKNQIKK